MGSSNLQKSCNKETSVHINCRQAIPQWISALKKWEKGIKSPEDYGLPCLIYPYIYDCDAFVHLYNGLSGSPAPV